MHMFLNLFLLYQVVRPLGRKSVNKYLCVLVCTSSVDSVFSSFHSKCRYAEMNLTMKEVRCMT